MKDIISQSEIDRFRAQLRDSPRTGLMSIAGERVHSTNGWIDCVNPATEQVVGRVPKGTEADVERAVDAAFSVQQSWAAASVKDRAAGINRLADGILERADELLAIEVANTGNSITGMRGDILGCVERLRYFAGLGHELQGTTVPESGNKLNLTVREPFGVVGRIVAFNHPLSMAVSGLASSLIAGNGVILKPSEQCPLSATILGEIADDALPSGLVNVVTGDGLVGSAIVRHPRVKRVSFVGSVQTGLLIQRQAAEAAVKSLSLELGGKNPFIVFPDAPIDEVVDAAILGMNFIWQGQSCTSTSRLYVHNEIYDEVSRRIAEKVNAIRIGDPFEWKTEMGAIVSKVQLDRVAHYVELGKKEGAKLLTGGRRPEGEQFQQGYWYEPTVFSEVTQDMTIAREEIFGPVLSIIRWSDVNDVLAMANSVDVGLTGAVWTRDISRALDTARRLQVGYLWINGVGSAARALPFGGYKNSGIGRERGLEELYSYTEEKSIQIFI